MLENKKFEYLLKLNDRGGKEARKIESCAKKLQPEAKDMFDLTEDTINKVYAMVCE